LRALADSFANDDTLIRIVNRSLGYAVPVAIVLAGTALCALQSLGWAHQKAVEGQRLVL
jgi:hypothetical protein